jgi:branched-chain amino acid transport system permease protein
MTTSEPSDPPQVSADITPPGHGGGAAAIVRFVVKADVRLLGCCLMASVVLALMTGPDGSTPQPTSGIAASLQPLRTIYFLLFGAALWLVMTITRMLRRGDLARLATLLRRIAAWAAKRWHHALRAKGTRWVLAVVSFAAMAVLMLLVAALTGPYVPNKVSEGTLRNQLHFNYTYGYLLLGIVLWRLITLRVLERHGLRAAKPAVRGAPTTTLVVVACLLGGLVLAIAANPWLSSAYRWSYLQFGGRPSIWGQWPTYLFVAGGLVVARMVLLRRARPTAPSSRTARRFVTPQLSLAGYVTVLFIAIEWPKFLATYWQSNITTQIGTYALLALGLNVVVGFAGLLDLGYVAFWAVGAYVTAYWTGQLPIHPPIVLNEFYVIPLAILAAMLAGVLLGLPTLRLRGDYLAIVTLGFGEIVEVLLNNVGSVTGGSQGVSGIPPFSINVLGIHYQWDVNNQLPFYYLLLVFIVVAFFIFYSLNHSRVGRRWAALRENEVAAASLGVNPLKYKVMAFAIGASTAGFAGLFTASSIGVLFPQSFILDLSILILALVIFGGVGSIVGVVFAAAFFQWIYLLLEIHPFPGYQQQDFYMYLGALFVLTMIFRPQGVIPSRRRAREIALSEAGVGFADVMGAERGSSNPFEGPKTSGGEVGPRYSA